MFTTWITFSSWEGWIDQQRGYANALVGSNLTGATSHLVVVDLDFFSMHGWKLLLQSWPYFSSNYFHYLYTTSACWKNFIKSKYRIFRACKYSRRLFLIPSFSWKVLQISYFPSLIVFDCVISGINFYGTACFSLILPFSM